MNRLQTLSFRYIVFYITTMISVCGIYGRTKWLSDDMVIGGDRFSNGNRSLKECSSNVLGGSTEQKRSGVSLSIISKGGFERLCFLRGTGKFTSKKLESMTSYLHGGRLSAELSLVGGHLFLENSAEISGAALGILSADDKVHLSHNGEYTEYVGKPIGSEYNSIIGTIKIGHVFDLCELHGTYVCCFLLGHYDRTTISAKDIDFNEVKAVEVSDLVRTHQNTVADSSSDYDEDNLMSMQSFEDYSYNFRRNPLLWSPMSSSERSTWDEEVKTTLQTMQQVEQGFQVTNTYLKNGIIGVGIRLGASTISTKNIANPGIYVEVSGGMRLMDFLSNTTMHTLLTRNKIVGNDDVAPSPNNRLNVYLTTKSPLFFGFRFVMHGNLGYGINSGLIISLDLCYRRGLKDNNLTKNIIIKDDVGAERIENISTNLIESVCGSGLHDHHLSFRKFFIGFAISFTI